MSVSRGEIYWMDFDPVKGSEQAGLRPALIIQNDLGNRYSRTTVVAAVTTSVPDRPYPFMVMVTPAHSGLAATSIINCAQITTVHQSGSNSRLRPPKGEANVRPIGKLDDESMLRVDEALRYNLGLE